MGWLNAGAEGLLFGAMEAVGGEFFRIGERLDTVLGDEHAREFIIDTMASASQAMQEHQSLPRTADSIRLPLMPSARPD